MRPLILIAIALLIAGNVRASGAPIDFDPASVARKIFKRKPQPRDPVSRDELIQQEREHRQRQARLATQKPEAEWQRDRRIAAENARAQRMAEALERARAQGVGQ